MVSNRPRQPNLVILILDTLRADHLSCYGYGRLTTPYLDSLAAEGLLFEQAFASSSWSLPSHVSLVTGLYPSEHRFWDLPDTARPLPKTIAEELAGAGYQTVCFSNNLWLSVGGFARAFERYHQHFHGGMGTKSSVDRVLRRLRWLGFVGDKGARSTLRGIRCWLRDYKERGRPFFMLVNLMEAHHPYAPRRPYHRSFTQHPYRAVWRQFLKAGRTKNYVIAEESWTHDSLTDCIALYDGEIVYLDTQIRKLVDILAVAGVIDDTILLVTSDHGETFGEHRVCGKRIVGHQFSLHAPVTRIPLVLWGRSLPVRGRMRSAVNLVDVPGGLLELAGVAPGDWQRRQLFHPRAAGFTVSEYRTPSSSMERLGRARRVYASGVDLVAFEKSLVAVRDARYSLIVDGNGEEAFFDRQRDPLEETAGSIEAASSPEATRAAVQLRQFYQDWVAGHYVCGSDSAGALEVDDSAGDLVKARLRELGYL